MSFILLCVLASGGSSGPKLSPAAMQSSIDFVAEKIERVHPKALGGLPPEVVTAVAAARARAASPLTSEELYFVLAELLTSLGDAHSQVEALNEMAHRVIPLPFVWLEEGIVVREDSGELRRGDIVRAIGGRDAADLLNELRKSISTENDHHLRAVASRTLVREDYLEHLGLFRQDRTVSLQVDRDGTVRKVTLPLVDPSPEPAGDPPFSFTIDPERSLGVLRLDECVYSEEYVTLLHDFMTEVAEQGIRRIAVDLRRNSGGNVMVAFAFLKYLDVPYRSFSVHQRISEPFLQQYPMFGQEAFVQLLQGFGIDRSGGSYQLPGEAVDAMLSQLVTLPTRPAKFQGDVFILTSSETFSSANLFATLIQDNGIGKIVGEPTGNEVNFHGQPVRVDIPGTAFRLKLATSLNQRPDATRSNQSAVIPDLPITTTAEDVRLGRDPQIEGLIQREGGLNPDSAQ